MSELCFRLALRATADVYFSSINRQRKELVLYQRATVLYHPLVEDLAKVAVSIPARSSQWKSDVFFFPFFCRNMPRFTIFSPLKKKKKKEKCSQNHALQAIKSDVMYAPRN